MVPQFRCNGIEASTNCCRLSAVSCQLSVNYLHFLHQGRQHLLHLFDLRSDLRSKALVCWSAQISQLMSKQKLVLKFASRPHCDLQEPPHLRVTLSTATLGDIHPDRCGGSSHLAC